MGNLEKRNIVSSLFLKMKNDTYLPLDDEQINLIKTGHNVIKISDDQICNIIAPYLLFNGLLLNILDKVIVGMERGEVAVPSEDILRLLITNIMTDCYTYIENNERMTDISDTVSNVVCSAILTPQIIEELSAKNISAIQSKAKSKKNLDEIIKTTSEKIKRLQDEEEKSRNFQKNVTDYAQHIVSMAINERRTKNEKN